MYFPYVRYRSYDVMALLRTGLLVCGLALLVVVAYMAAQAPCTMLRHAAHVDVIG